jgi:AcrR family transcriptional regulator
MARDVRLRRRPTLVKMQRMGATRATRRRYGGKSAQERRAERHAALVEAGRRIWQEHGWAAVTMRGVCAEAGLTDRYFYESFADRDALLAHIWDQARDEVIEVFLGALQPLTNASPLDKLRAAAHALVHHIEEEPVRAEIIFGDHAGSAVLEQQRRNGVQRSTDLLLGLARPFLRKGVDERAFRIHVLVGMGGFVELMLAWRSGLIDADADTLVEHLMDVSAALAPRFLRPGLVG